MTEAEWLACDDPVAMLAWLWEKDPSATKLDLFAAACRGRPYHYLSPQFNGAGASPDGRLWMSLKNAEDHDDVFATEWDGPTGLAFLRCLFGNPFRPATPDPACRAPAVTSLARAAYEERLPGGELEPARLAVLADALEEAGCADPDLLGHLRSAGPHVRECWALELILGGE
jgi:hypothetical protein